MNEIELRVEALSKAMLIGTFESGSPEWHEARAGIGGSDIGTICGVNRYQTRQELLESRLRPSEAVSEPNLAMRLGTAFEPAIRRLWLEDNSQWLTVVETGTWQSLENPFWKANPDGLIRWNDGEIGILEIKNSQAPTLSDSWLYQVNWYLMVLGLRRAVLVQCKGNRFIEHSIEGNVNIQAEMRAAAKLFEKEITNGTLSR
jgi:predicted phage-related endonuclease